MKGTRQRNIAEISCALAASGRYRNLESCLYEFCPPCWTLRKPEFVESYLRPEIDNIFPGLADYLSYRNLQEIYRQLCGRLPMEKRSKLENCNQKYLCCIDGLYRISDGAILPPDPGLDLFSYLNVRTSKIGRGNGYYTELFLTNATNGDSALRARLLEMVAVILTAMPLKRFFLLEGPGDTGKGQLIKFLRYLLGNSSCFNVSSINELSRPFTTSNLVDKLMCCCPDIPDETLNAKVIGIIKQIVGDDTVHGEIKFGPSIDFDCYAKLVFASNAPLKVPYHGGKEAFIRRMIHIPFHNSVPEDKQIPQLYQHLLNEAGYFIGLALEQRKKFIQRKCVFTELPDLEWKTVQPPDDEQRIVTFIQSCCELTPNATTPVTNLYDAFSEYDMFFGTHPIERSQFSRLLQQGPFQLQGGRKSTYRYICGIRLKEQFQPAEP